MGHDALRPARRPLHVGRLRHAAGRSGATTTRPTWPRTCAASRLPRAAATATGATTTPSPTFDPVEWTVDQMNTGLRRRARRRRAPAHRRLLRRRHAHVAVLEARPASVPRVARPAGRRSRRPGAGDVRLPLRARRVRRVGLDFHGHARRRASSCTCDGALAAKAAASTRHRQRARSNVDDAARGLPVHDRPRPQPPGAAGASSPPTRRAGWTTKHGRDRGAVLMSAGRYGASAEGLGVRCLRRSIAAPPPLSADTRRLERRVDATAAGDFGQWGVDGGGLPAFRYDARPMDRPARGAARARTARRRPSTSSATTTSSPIAYNDGYTMLWSQDRADAVGQHLRARQQPLRRRLRLPQRRRQGAQHALPDRPPGAQSSAYFGARLLRRKRMRAEGSRCTRTRLRAVRRRPAAAPRRHAPQHDRRGRRRVSWFEYWDVNPYDRSRSTTAGIGRAALRRGRRRR